MASLRRFPHLPVLVVIHLIIMGQSITATEVIERSQQLSPRLGVTWTVDFDTESVTFVVTGETHGFIGFGLSPQGGMNGADVVIGGVLDDGEPYFSDRFATTESEPKIDDHQDWFLILAYENSTHTVLQFNRTMDTCDPEDFPMTNDTTKFIWSLGTSDDIVYHGEQRGTAAVNILDPPMPAYDTSKFDTWELQVNTTIPTVDTVYWCTLHKSPKFFSKRQIVGFETMLNSTAAIQHSHHLNVHMCQNKPGSAMNELLESYVNHPGGLCYDPTDGTGIQNLTQFCSFTIYVWTKGGEPLFLPENVGFPLNEDGTEEYFLLELHYDNPQALANVQYDTGVRLYLTDDLRPQDAGLMVVGYESSITQTIPPSSRDFLYASHCSSRCTSTEIPDTGVEIFNVLLHAHLSGRRIKFRQFRPQVGDDGNQTFVELPWISYDDRYDFDFQQNRPLKQPAKMLPGDHFTVECTYDTTWINPPGVTVGGLSTREEMCAVIFMYYPKIPLSYCSSYHPLDRLLSIFGIEQIDPGSHPSDPIVVQPMEFAGLNFSTVLNTLVDWTPELRNDLQVKVRYGDHVEECFTSTAPEGMTSVVQGKASKKENFEWTNYPKDFIQYFPPDDNCGS